jgi:hypothetical protein
MTLAAKGDAYRQLGDLLLAREFYDAALKARVQGPAVVRLDRQCGVEVGERGARLLALALGDPAVTAGGERVHLARVLRQGPVEVPAPLVEPALAHQELAVIDQGAVDVAGAAHTAFVLRHGAGRIAQRLQGLAQGGVDVGLLCSCRR